MAQLLKVLQQEFDNNGDPIYGSIVIKNHDTNDLSTLFSDIDETPMANPVNLPASGRISIFTGNGLYDVFLQSELDGLGTTVQQSLGVSGGIGLGLGSETVVNTISEMRGLTPGATDYVIVGGYYEKGDGKAIEKYWYDETLDFSIEPHNGGTIIQPNSAPPVGGYRAVLDGSPITPYNFGAYGDRTNDDYIAMVNALTYAYQSGLGYLYLDVGEFRVNQAIDLATIFNITTATGNAGYFRLYGAGLEKSRIIPGADITGGLIKCDLTIIGAGARARELKFEKFSIYSDASANLNFSAEYGLSLTWIAQVYISEFGCFNAVTKRALNIDSCFPVKIEDSVLVGKENAFADAGMGGAPDAVDIARSYASVPSDPVDQMTGIYIWGISTTVWINNVRARSFINGCNINSGELISIGGVNAFESNKDSGTGSPLVTRGYGHGILVTGAVTNLTIQGLYPEGNDHSVGINGTVISCDIANNFFHDVTNIRLYGSKELNGMSVHHNMFRDGFYAILDDGATYKNFSFYDNTIYAGRDQKDTFISIPSYNNAVNRTNMSFYNNRYIINGTNEIIPFFDRDSSDLVDYPLGEWNVSGDLVLSESDDKYLNNQTYNISSASSGNINRTIIPSIDFINNQGLLGNWFTMQIPVTRIGLTSGISFTLRYKNSGSGDALTVTGRADIKSITGTFSNDSGNLSFSTAQDFSGFTKVRFTNSGGALPTGIVAGTAYYLNRYSAGNYYIATSIANADSDINIVYTDSGSGTQTLFQYDYWRLNYIYFQIPVDAQFLRVTITPTSGECIVGTPSIFRGLWGDSMGSKPQSQRIQIKPTAIRENHLEVFAGPDFPTQKTIIARSTGNPGVGIIEARNSNVVGGALHGTQGFAALINQNYIVNNAQKEMGLYHGAGIKARVSAEGLSLDSAGPSITSGAGEPGTPQAFTASAYGQLLITHTTDIPSGTSVQFTSSGTLPTGITSGSVYYTIRQSATTSLINSNPDSVEFGLGIAYTDAGTGTHTLIFSNGSSETCTASSYERLLLTYTNNVPNWHRFRVSTSGTLPTGLAISVNYFAIKISATTCMVATSLALAQAGTAIAYTDAGTGSHTVALAHLQGSLYLRTDGSSTTTRAYINTNGISSWTNLVTGA